MLLHCVTDFYYISCEQRCKANSQHTRRWAIKQLNGRHLEKQETLKARAYCLEAELPNSMTSLTTWRAFSLLLTAIWKCRS